MINSQQLISSFPIQKCKNHQSLLEIRNSMLFIIGKPSKHNQQFIKMIHKPMTLMRTQPHRYRKTLIFGRVFFILIIIQCF
jgi:hypothetical protein